VRHERISVWSLRCVWLLQPLTLGPGCADILQHTQSRTFLSIGLWGLWGFGFLATLIPCPLTLTTIRISGPVVGVLSVWSSLATDNFQNSLVGLIGGLALLVLALWPAVADAYVDGASYGNERRFLLRAPASITLILAPLAWLFTLIGTLSGPALLAQGSTTPAIVSFTLGLPIAAACSRAIHHLHRRWVVLVPTGLVLHDHLALADPTLITRKALMSIGPAAINSDGHDLTHGAHGLAIEVRSHEPYDLRLNNRKYNHQVITTSAFLCTPVCPNAFLSEANRRKLPVRHPAKPPPRTSSPS